jgi:hypothetical protein
METHRLNIKKYPLIVILGMFLIACFSSKDDDSNVSFSFTNSVAEKSFPIKYEYDRIYIPVILEDSVSCDLLLDSGTNNLSFDSTFIAENKDKLGMLIYSESSGKVYSPEGLYKRYPIIFVWNVNAQRRRDSLKLQIGNSIFYHSHPDVYSKNIQTGIFPLHILTKEKIVNINVKEKYMMLLDSITNKADSISFTIDPSTSAPILKASVKIDTADTCYHINGNFLLDFGFRGAILFPESILKKELKNMPFIEFLSLSSTLQRVTSMKETINTSITLDLGNYTIQNTSIVFSSFLPPNITGIIGMAFLKHLNFAVDYRNLLFHYFVSDSNVVTNPFFDIYKKSYYGIRIQKNKENFGHQNFLYINEILKNGKADSLGIQLKDPVIKVNEIEVNENNYEALFDSIPKSRSLSIQKKDDSIIKIEFEK